LRATSGHPLAGHSQAPSANIIVFMERDTTVLRITDEEGESNDQSEGNAPCYGVATT